ncbi:TPA: hypothetical protein ACQ31I_004187, partial [Yersinia enterocolitica]
MNNIEELKNSSLIGVTDEMLVGGWTAKKLSDYAKFLEKQNTDLATQLEAAHKDSQQLQSMVEAANLAKKQSSVLKEKRLKPVAEVVSKFGDPEAFGEREIKILADLRSIPYNTKLYAVAEQLQPNTLISFDELADIIKFVTGGIRMEFDPKFCKGHQAVPFMNFNSLSRIVEMYRATETYRLAGGGSYAEIKVSSLSKDSR